MPPPPREPDSPSPGGQIASLSPPKTKETPPAIAISATFTAEGLEPTLAFWLRELKLDFHIRFAPYNQVFQQLLDPLGLLAGNRNCLMWFWFVSKIGRGFRIPPALRNSNARGGASNRR